METDYLKLWRERFAAKSERYIENPDQLRIDFGDTDEAADAAEGLADAVAEIEVPAHTRAKCRKKRVESLPAGETDYGPMLPWNCANEHPENIRQYRQAERNDRSERKQSRRDQRRVRERLLQRRPRKR